MYNITLTRCLVVSGVILLFGVGFYVYNSYVELSDVRTASLPLEQTDLDAEGVDSDTVLHSPDSLDKTDDNMAVYKKALETYSSKHNPVKIRIAETGMPDDAGVKTVPNEGTPKEYYKEDLVPQWVQTPDGQVHKIYWFEKLKRGQAIPPPHEWAFTDKVVVDGVMYDVPEHETADSYIDMIRLSTIYDVPLDSVDSLVEAGVIPSSPIEAEKDPLFQDPLFVKRKDSRPVEARSGYSLADWGMDTPQWAALEQPRPVQAEMVMLDGELALIDSETGTVIRYEDSFDEREGGARGGIDTLFDQTSEPVPVADDSNPVLADALEKPKLPKNMGVPEKQLTPPATDAGIHQHSTDERLRRLEKVWESVPEMKQQFEQEHSPDSQLHRNLEHSKPSGDADAAGQPPDDVP